MSIRRVKRHKNQRGGVSGRFMAVPHAVLDSVSYLQLPTRAVKLLMDIAYQYNGRNNGDLTVAWGLWRGGLVLERHLEQGGQGFS